MTSDSTPVFALEKEALKTEIETGLQVGVDHLEDKPMKRKPVEDQLTWPASTAYP